MKYFKYAFFVLLVLLLWVGNYFYHKLVFNNNSTTKNYSFLKKLEFKNDYFHYFFLKNVTPLYTFKNDILTKYQKYSFENHKSWLIFPHQETLADLKYIQDIQYLASFRNTYEAKQLYSELNYVTNLSPYRVGIYVLGLLVMPAWTKSSGMWFFWKMTNWKQTVKLGEKGVFFNCNKNKIKNILSLPNSEYFKYAYSKTGDFYLKNSNPCKSIDLPSQLAFDYFFYLRDLKNSAKYYKVAWFQKDALPGIIWMVAVVNWIMGEHEKAIYLMLNKAAWIYNKLVKEKSTKEKKLLENLLNWTIKRAQAELNFYIVSQADTKHPECNKNYDCLVKKWYIAKEINNLVNKCRKIYNPYKIKSFTDLFSQNISYSLQNAKCFLLLLNIQTWYIKNGQLKTVLRKNWTYYWNPDYETWWEK